MAKQKIEERQIENIKVVVDRSKCISCGTCTVIAPKTFEMNDKGEVKIKSEGPYDNPKTIKEAAEMCCVEAIKLEQVSG